MRAAVVLSSGFAEAGPAGRQRQAELERLATERGLLICGPNCYGVFNIRLGAATFSADMAEPLRPGVVGVVSQSGGFSHAIAEHLMQQRCVGVSYIVSCGNQAGLTVEDDVAYLVEDDDTHVIGVFVEGFKQPDTFRQAAARARALGKPIVVLKVGRSENARQAMLAHTGSLAGTPEIVEAMLKQSGVVQVSSLNEMIDTLTLLPAARRHAPRRLARRDPERARRRVRTRVRRRRSRGRRAAAALGGHRRGHEGLHARLRQSPEPDRRHRRHVRGRRLFPQLIDILLRDDAIDVVAVNLRVNVPKPGGCAPSRQFSHGSSRRCGGTDRLVLAFNSFAGGDLDQEVVGALADVGVPFLESTETALLALRHAREHRRFLDRPDSPPSSRAAPRASARLSGTLGNADAMQLLRDFGIPLAETVAAKDAETAVPAADRLGYPVALKIDSPDIAHKTDVGGVRVGCADAAAVRAAIRDMLDEVPAAGTRRRGSTASLVQRMIGGGREMILGVKTDPLFGPAVVCGFGGIFVEQLRDVSVRVPPIDAADAHGDDRRAARRRAPVGRARPAAGRRARAGRHARPAGRTGRRVPRTLRALDINPLLVLDEGRGVVAVDWLIELA